MPVHEQRDEKADTKPVNVEGRKETGPRRSKMEFAKSAAKLVLKAVVEVSDVFPPLKSVAAGVQLIVDCIEVGLSLLWGRYIGIDD